MKRTLLLVILLAGTALLFVPAVKASGDDWQSAKPKLVTLGKTECLSDATKVTAISGDQIVLPVEGGKILVKATAQKVLIDKDNKGTPDFVGAQGQRYNSFQVNLVYGNGDKTKYTLKITKAGAAWAYIRDCALEYNVDGNKMWVVDENNNGIYGEAGADGIYVGKSDRGAKFGSLVTFGDKVMRSR
jgi:hypothetical protein